MIYFLSLGVVHKVLMKMSFHVEWKSTGFIIINGVKDYQKKNHTFYSESKFDVKICHRFFLSFSFA